MFPFTKLGPIDRTEMKALLFAFLFCALFIVLLGVAAPAKRTRKKSLTVLAVPPTAVPPKLREPSAPASVDPLEPYRVVPEPFTNIDFKNYSYGVYTLGDGKEIDLTLSAGKLGLPDELGWFALKDVYYKDVVGDRRPEAIVRLSHVQYGGSGHRAADLFYVYALSNEKLTTIWRYETGSYEWGCGLKSLTLENKQIVLGLFGRCPRQAMDYPGQNAKFMVEDLTFILFEYDGRSFLTKRIQYIPEPSRNVKNSQPEISLF